MKTTAITQKYYDLARTEVQHFMGEYHSSATNMMFQTITRYEEQLEELQLFKSEHLRLEAELNTILHPNGDGPTTPSFCDLVAFVKADLAPKRCISCAFDQCGCSVQDMILQLDPTAEFGTFGCVSHEKRLVPPTPAIWGLV